MLDINDILAVDSDAAFERAALELFAFQSRECEPYREYLALMGEEPGGVRRSVDIPHLPIEIFRRRRVYCGPPVPEMVFTSSTTGGDTPSLHYVYRLDWYRACFMASFRALVGEPGDYSFYCLLPGYLEREGSSLAYMATGLVEAGGGGFFLRNYDELISRMGEDPRPKILLGVSYALWDLAEGYAPKLKDTIVMETGGMKGRREELPKEEFHGILCRAFGVEAIHSEYGMAELSSQAYSDGGGIFRTPPWMRVMVRDINDPMEIYGPANPLSEKRPDGEFSSGGYLSEGDRRGRTGGINITDLGNVCSCAFIQTQDLGRLYRDGSFSILGRIDRSMVRGCNLLVDGE